MRTRLARLVVGFAFLAGMIGPTGARGADPTPREYAPWPRQVKTLGGDWSAQHPPPTWMRPSISRAADDANLSSASRAPDFRIPDSSPGVISYLTGGQSTCPRGTEACARPHPPGEVPTYWRVTMLKQGERRCPAHGSCYSVDWCESSNTFGGCTHVRRAVLHELGHVLDLDHHPDSSEKLSVMYYILPGRDSAGHETTGSLTHQYLACDQARLQLDYDVTSDERSYSPCLPGVPIKTTLTISTVGGDVCASDSARVAGRLKVGPGNGKLSGNNLGSRRVDIQRRAVSGGAFATVATVMTRSNGEWSKEVGAPAAGTYVWRVRFAGDTGVSGATSPLVSIRWVGTCLGSTSVDCTATPSALTDALAAASASDTLVISGDCAGPVTVTKSVSLRGGPEGWSLDADRTALTVSAGAIVRVMDLTIPGGSGPRVVNSGNLTLVASQVTGLEGHGIDNHGNLALVDSTVTDARNVGISNHGDLLMSLSTVSGTTGRTQGVGILNEGPATIVESTVSGNNGGGIINNGDLVLRGSTISDNDAGVFGGNGGGIYNASTATVTDSKVTDNHGTDGGGIYNIGTLTVARSTVSDNAADHQGGGIFNTSNHLLLTDVTYADNLPDDCLGC